MKLGVVVVVVLFALEVQSYPDKKEDEQKLLRSRIITKHNFMNFHRKKKSGNFEPKVPKPFVISTQLNVRDSSSGRRGRTWTDGDGTTVVEGIRMPDDESDRVTWRNGRVINNVFIPNEVFEAQGRQGKVYSYPDQVATADQSQQKTRDYKYHAGNTDNGRPVYYVVEEPDSLHSDRSPYTYEPADIQTSISSQVADYTNNGVSLTKQQSPSNYVIKEQTYSMCPGCPTFSIPVPVPKSAVQSQHSQTFNYPPKYATKPHHLGKNETFLEKIGNSVYSRVESFQQMAMRLFGLGKKNERTTELSDKKDQLVSSSNIYETSHQIGQKIEDESESSSPLGVAGMMALAIGGMTLISSVSTLAGYSGVAAAGRSLDQDVGPNVQTMLQSATDYMDMFKELNWDADCIRAELCRKNLLKHEKSLSSVEQVIRKK